MKNPIQNSDGTIDCEINHPIHGWILFTASPEDPEAHGRMIYAELITNHEIAQYVKPQAEIDAELAAAQAAEIEQVRQELLDAIIDGKDGLITNLRAHKSALEIARGAS